MRIIGKLISCALMLTCAIIANAIDGAVYGWELAKEAWNEA